MRPGRSGDPRRARRPGQRTRRRRPTASARSLGLWRRRESNPCEGSEQKRGATRTYRPNPRNRLDRSLPFAPAPSHMMPSSGAESGHKEGTKLRLRRLEVRGPSVRIRAERPFFPEASPSLTLGTLVHHCGTGRGSSGDSRCPGKHGRICGGYSSRTREPRRESLASWTGGSPRPSIEDISRVEPPRVHGQDPAAAGPCRSIETA
jgi:hypothetical protein